MIEKKFEEEFRSCVCKFDSMAIADKEDCILLTDHMRIMLEPTDDEQEFIEDLFLLGRLFEMRINLTY